MFNFFKSKLPTTNYQILSLKLSGMHCSSCAVNIDLTLEDLSGVASSDTNYAQSTLCVKYHPGEINPQRIKEEIEKLGYKATIAD